MSERVAVIGHVEWVTHAIGPVPRSGDIVHLDRELEEPAGGGAVSAVEAARLGARARFYTALGADEIGTRSEGDLTARGVEVLAVFHDAPQSRALTVVELDGERTILVTGERLSPGIDDALPWRDLARCDAAYFTGDDPATLVAARAARHLVITARRLDALTASGVQVDVLVASASDPTEAFDRADLPVAPRVLVHTDGARGGRFAVEGGPEHRYEPAPVPGPIVDSYGCGDCFAADLTVGLARGLRLDAALALAAASGAAALTRRGGIGPVPTTTRKGTR